MSSFRKRLLANVLVVTVPLVLALVSLGLIGLYGNTDAGVRAVVTSDDGRVWELPLDVDKTLVVSTGAGSNTIQVEGGEVQVVDADCPGKDCVLHAPISRPGQTIICLPHRLTVVIVAQGGKQADLPANDAVADGGAADDAAADSVRPTLQPDVVAD